MEPTRFLARDQELGQLLALSKGRRNAMPVLLVSATAGMGKSRLIAEHRRIAEPARVFAVGACLQYAGSVLAPFTQIVRSLAERFPQTISAHPRIFKRLGDVGDGDASALDVPPREDKLRVFELYGSALRAFSREAPITIVLEDLQWADSNSLELLQYLAHASGTSNLVLVATYRSDDLGREHPLRGLVGRLSPLSTVERIDLRPLDDADIDVIVQDILAGTLVEKTERRAIRARAEGNPLFAEELARHVRDRCDRAGLAGLPLSIEEAVSARLPLLTGDETSLLLRAAVIGRDFDAQILATVAGVPLAQVLEVLRRARELAFVVEGPPPRFMFRHALTQEALYNELLETERRTIHGQTLAILETQAGGTVAPAALAYHAWAARDAAKSVRYNECAGDVAAQARAVVEAATLYERALDMCDADVDAARLEQKRAAMQLSAGFPQLAIASYSAALTRVSGRHEETAVAACALGIAEAFSYLGDDERGLEYLEKARDVLAAQPRHHLRVRATLYSARIALADREMKSALGHLSAVEEFCDALDNRSATLFYTTRADAKLMLHRYDEAIADQTRAVELAVGGNDPRYEAEQRAQLGAVLLLAGRLELAGAAYRDACRVAEEHFDIAQAALYRTHFAEVRLMLGWTQEAKAIVLDLLALAVETENPAFIVLLGRVGLFLGLRTGDRELCKRIVDRLELDARFERETPRQLFPVSGAYAQMLIDQGRIDEAKVVLRRAVDRLTHKRLRSTDWSICTLITVAVHGSPDDIVTAREVLASSFSALASAFLSFFDAIASLRAQREDEARAFARAAASGLRSFAFRYEEALAWELAEEKQVALDMFTQQGAHNDVRRLQRSMLTLNRRGRASNELTAREHEVALAIARGETNRMIAERYCISEKTVESHVASIFNRLGIRARCEVAARLESLMAVAER
jgi:predicted ATPase/DNA-binding NarL/FixJ family response regulator